MTTKAKVEAAYAAASTGGNPKKDDLIKLFDLDHTDRAAFIAEIPNMDLSVGQVARVGSASGTLQFRFIGGAVSHFPNAELDGWVPDGVLRLSHFAENTAPGITDMSAAWLAMRDYVVGLGRSFPVQVDLGGGPVGLLGTKYWTAGDIGVHLTGGPLVALGVAADYPSIVGDDDPVKLKANPAGDASMPGPLLSFSDTSYVIIDMQVECGRICSGVRFNNVSYGRITDDYYAHGWASGGYGFHADGTNLELHVGAAHAEQYTWGESGFDDQANRVGYGFMFGSADITGACPIANYTGVGILVYGFGSWSISQPHPYNGALATVTDADNIIGLYILDPANGVVTAPYLDNAAIMIDCDGLNSTSGKTLQVVQMWSPVTGNGSNAQQLILTTAEANNDLAGLKLSGFLANTVSEVDMRTTGSGSYIENDYLRWDIELSDPTGQSLDGIGNLMFSKAGGHIKAFLDKAANTFEVLFRADTIRLRPKSTAGTDIIGHGDIRFMADYDNNSGSSNLALGVDGSYKVVLDESGLEINALVQGTAVTQTNLDTTVGRLLKVGDFGAGYSVIISDFNSGTESATYQFDSASPANAPVVGGINWTLAAFERNNGNNVSQIAFAPASSVMFTRHKSSGVWGSWAKVLDSSNTTVDANGFIKAV